MAKVVAPFVRSPFNYDRDAASDESGLKCEDPSLAVQSQRDEADINTIVKRFNLTGQLPTNVRAPTYGDFTGVGDYRDALNAVRAAEDSFMRMPAAVRARFENDPAKFVDFCSDPANIKEMVSLGLAVVVDPPAAAPDSSATSEVPAKG